MPLEEQITQLKMQAEQDKGAADVLLKAGYYSHALFWMHLALEKLCKALWIYRNKTENYPYIHKGASKNSTIAPRLHSKLNFK